MRLAGTKKMRQIKKSRRVRLEASTNTFAGAQITLDAKSKYMQIIPIEPISDILGWVVILLIACDIALGFKVKVYLSK